MATTKPAAKKAAPKKKTAIKKVSAPLTAAPSALVKEIDPPIVGESVIYVCDGVERLAKVELPHGGLRADLTVHMIMGVLSFATVKHQSKAAKGEAYWKYEG